MNKTNICYPMWGKQPGTMHGLICSKIKNHFFSNLCRSFHLQYIRPCKYIYRFQDPYQCTWQTRGNPLYQYRIFSFLNLILKNGLNRLWHHRFVLIWRRQVRLRHKHLKDSAIHLLSEVGIYENHKKTKSYQKMNACEEFAAKLRITFFKPMQIFPSPVYPFLQVHL